MDRDRRASERIPLPVPLRYQQKGSQQFGNSIGRDISDTGIGFVSNEFFPISTDLIFEVQHPKTHNFIKAVGRIVWISHEPYSDRFTAGARFLGPPISI